MIKDEGSDIYVKVGKSPPCIGLQDQGVGDIWRPGVTPQDACARLGGVDINAYHTYTRFVTESQMGGIPAYKLGQVGGCTMIFSTRARQYEILVKF